VVEWIGGFDVYGSSREGMFETDEEGNPVLARGWSGKEFDLVVAGADVELGADAWIEGEGSALE
jgi:hypothetical protein